MNNSRLQSLDGLRGIAAISVVLFHFSYQYFNIFTDGVGGGEYFYYGGMGVQLFFVISGFVISISLFKSSGYKRFLISRMSRLYPPYWFAVLFSALLIVLTGFFPGKNVSIDQLLFNLSMFQYFFGVDDIDGVYWTLRVEITFYIWFALAFYFFKYNLYKIFLFFWVLLSILIPMANSFWGLYDSFIIMKVFDRLLILQFFPFFGAGIAFYFLWHKTESFFSYSILSMSFLAVFLNHDVKYVVVMVLIYVLFFICIVMGRGKIFLESSVLVFLGGISYSLYLSHQILGYYVIDNILPFLGREVSILVALVLCVVFAWWMSIYIENNGQKKMKLFLLKIFNGQKL